MLGVTTVSLFGKAGIVAMTLCKRRHHYLQQ